MDIGQEQARTKRIMQDSRETLQRGGRQDVCPTPRDVGERTHYPGHHLTLWITLWTSGVLKHAQLTALATEAVAN
jgi:hypothetical protein